jgi:hypothetical protein
MAPGLKGPSLAQSSAASQVRLLQEMAVTAVVTMAGIAIIVIPDMAAIIAVITIRVTDTAIRGPIRQRLIASLIIAAIATRALIMAVAVIILVRAQV